MVRPGQQESLANHDSDAEMQTLYEKFSINTPERKAEFNRIVQQLDKLVVFAEQFKNTPSAHSDVQVANFDALLTAITSGRYYPVWKEFYERSATVIDVNVTIARELFAEMISNKIARVRADLQHVRDLLKARTTPATPTGVDTSKEPVIHGLDFSRKPELPEDDTWLNLYIEMFDEVISKIEDKGKSPESRRELLIVLEAFINQSNKIMINFFRSNSKMNHEASGFMKFILPFARAEASDRHNSAHGVFTRFEKILENLLSPEEAEYWRIKYGSQGLMMLQATYIDDLGRIRANNGGIASLACNYEELKQTDVGGTDRSGDEDYNISNTFDFFTHFEKEIGKDLVFEHSRTLRVIMFLLPFLMNDFEIVLLPNGWDHKDSGETKEQFSAFINLFIDYLILNITYKQAVLEKGERSQEARDAQQKLNSFLRKDKSIGGVDEAALKKYFVNFEKRYDDLLKRKNRDGKNSQKFFTEKDGKIVCNIAREEEFLSMGKDETVEFSKEDVKNLLQEKDPDAYQRRIIQFLAVRMGTSLGVGLHNFNTRFSTGATPPGGIAYYQDMMKAVNPYGAANYACYKGIRPHPLSLYYRVDWDLENFGKDNTDEQAIITYLNGTRLEDRIIDPTVGKIPGSFENVSNILISQHLTRLVNKAISGGVRKHRVKLGSLNSYYDHIETAYPDAYSFVILASRQRQDANKKTGFLAWWTGFEKYKEFALKTDGVPGGSLDFEAIAKKDPEAFRAELLQGLKDIIQNTFSPLKAAMFWFRWDHIAQNIIMYIDKMYKIYRICDNTDSGQKFLTDGIQRILKEDSANMAGMGLTKFSKVRGSNPPMYKVSRGLVASYMQTEEKKDFYFGKDVLTEAEMQAGKKAEQDYKALVPGSHDQVKNIGMLLPRGGKMPSFEALSDSAREKAEMPDIRDYILNFIPRATIKQGLGITMLSLVNDARLDPAALRIARTEPKFGVNQVIRTGSNSIKRRLFEMQNKLKARVLDKQIQMSIYGVPEEAKK